MKQGPLLKMVPHCLSYIDGINSKRLTIKRTSRMNRIPAIIKKIRFFWIIAMTQKTSIIIVVNSQISVTENK